MNSTETKASSIEQMEVNDDYYREESCPIDGRVRQQSQIRMAAEMIGEVKQELLKCFFDSTEGVITKRDWMWMLGIGFTGAIAFTIVKSAAIAINDPLAPATRDASLEQFHQPEP